MSSQSHSESPPPSLGRSRVARSAARPLGGIPYMSERQTQAYLMARDAVRRVQRTSSLGPSSVGEMVPLYEGQPSVTVRKQVAFSDTR